MPNVRMGSNTRDQLLVALRSYRGELGEIISYIKEQAQFARLRAEDYMPKDLSEEYEAAEQSERIVQSFSDEMNRYSGQNVPDRHLRLMASALELRLEDLETRLQAIEADPLMPAEAVSPLRSQIKRILEERDSFWGKFGESPWLSKLRERRALKMGLAYPHEVDLEAVLADGEGQTIEFMEKFPDQAHDLAKEIAAFGTTNPGTILLGVTDSGAVAGLKGMKDAKACDRLRTRIEGVSSNAVIPSLSVRVKFVTMRRRTVAVIEVPKGPEPVYYTRSGVPYIRHGSLSRPALPQEINELVRRHLERKG